MIRYGHIPYNPIAHQCAIKKKKENDKEINPDSYPELDYDNIDIDMDYDR